MIDHYNLNMKLSGREAFVSRTGVEVVENWPSLTRQFNNVRQKKKIN